MANFLTGIQSYFALHPRIVSILSNIAEKYPFFYIDGIIFDAGVGMMMSCRGINANCLTIHLKEPNAEEKKDSVLFTSFRTKTNEFQEFPQNLKIWIAKEVISGYFQDGENTFIDIVILNENYNPPILYAEIK